MNELATVNKFDNLTRIEYQGQLVLTTAQLAEFYECTVDNLRVNFSYAQKESRFIEGKHFFKLEGDALKEFKDYVTNSYVVKNCIRNSHVVGNRAPSLYLWTKRGAARHAKMLNNDKAWEVFEILEDNYFDETVDYHDTTPGAPFWWELKKKPRCKKDPNSNRTLEVNIRRANALCKLADRTGDAELREQLLTEAANLLKGE